MIVSPARTAEPIEMPFWMWTRVSPENNVLDEGPDPPCRWQFCNFEGWHIIKYKECLPLAAQKQLIDRDAVWNVDLGGSKEAL